MARPSPYFLYIGLKRIYVILNITFIKLMLEAEAGSEAGDMMVPDSLLHVEADCTMGKFWG